MFQSFSLGRWARGVVQLGEPDTIPENALRRALNIRLDRTLGVIETRPGWTRKMPAAVAGAITFMHRLYNELGTWLYIQEDNVLYLLNESFSIVTQTLAGVVPEALSAVNSPDGEGSIWAVFVNRFVAFKDRSAATWRVLGIEAPRAAPLAAAPTTDLTLVINTGHSLTGWTGPNTSAFALDTAVFHEPPNSIRYVVEPDTFGGAQLNQAGSIELIPGGDSRVRNDDYFTFWVHFFFLSSLSFFQVDVDIDDGTFLTNLYSLKMGQLELDTLPGQWKFIQKRKSEFQRFGSNPNRNWTTAVAYRFMLQATSTSHVIVHLSNIQLRGGIGLEGTIQYTATYKNANTGGRGNPPKDTNFALLSTAPAVTDRTRMQVNISNIVAGGVDATTDPQIDTIQMWRTGGAFTSYVLVEEIPFSTPGPLWIDTHSDEELILTNVQLELDNDMPPLDTTDAPRFIFGPSASGHYFMAVNRSQLYVSKPYEVGENRIDNWPRLGYMIVGDGSAPIVAGCAQASQVIVWTDRDTFTIVGADAASFLPMRIEGSKGIVGRYAWAVGSGGSSSNSGVNTGAIFFVSYDGVYMQQGLVQQKLTGAIDPFFRGIDKGGQIGLSQNPLLFAEIRLGFLHEPQGSMLVMLYADQVSTVLNGVLVLKPNLETGALTECFFDNSLLTQIRSLLLDPPVNELLAGCANGLIYRIENPNVYTDDGFPVAWRARTQAHLGGSAVSQKYFSGVVVEGNTHNVPVTAQLIYDRDAQTLPLGTVNTGSEVSLVHFSTPDPRVLHHDAALELSSTTITRSAIVRCEFRAEAQPAQTRLSDSGDVPFPFVTQVKTVILDFVSSGDLTLTLSIDQQVRYSGRVFASPTRTVLRYPLPAGLRGRVFRLTLGGTAAFTVYSALGLLRQFGIEQDYKEHILIGGA